MSDTAHVLEASRLIEGKAFLSACSIFRSYFHHAKVRQALYGIHLLLGLIVALGTYSTRFQASTSSGPPKPVIAVVAYFL